MAQKLIRPADLQAKGIPLSNKQLKRLEAAGRFPKRVRLSARRYAYSETEIDAWCEQRVLERDGRAA